MKSVLISPIYFWTNTISSRRAGVLCQNSHFGNVLLFHHSLMCGKVQSAWVGFEPQTWSFGVTGPSTATCPLFTSMSSCSAQASRNEEPICRQCQNVAKSREPRRASNPRLPGYKAHANHSAKGKSPLSIPLLH